MKREKDINTSVLIDLYGALLSEKQRGMMSMYFDLDYSLSEIAENTGISRQGVLDNIKHGEARLKEIEASIGVKYKYEKTEAELENIENNLGEVPEDTRKRIMKCIMGIRSVWED